MSVDEARRPVHRGTARLCPKQRLQDRGPSEGELGAQIGPHGRARGGGNGRGTCSDLPVQDAPSAAGGGRNEQVLTGGFELPVPRGLLLVEGLALLRSPASLGSAAPAGHAAAPRLRAEEGVGSHVAGGLSFAPFPDGLVLLEVGVRVRPPAQGHPERGPPLSQVRAGLLGLRYGRKGRFPLASGRQRGGRGGIASCAVPTAAT